MADWKQITARIRRARTSKDPAGQLASLFSKTRDAMVAFELARYFETTGNSVDAGKWYFTAAERFRRSDWKTKAQESATRLGATEPAEIPSIPAAEREPLPQTKETSPESEIASVETEAQEPVAEPAAAELAPAAAPRTTARPRRGRRGGRGHSPVTRRTESSAHRRETPALAAAAPTLPPLEVEKPSRASHSSVEDSVSEAPAPALRGRSGDPGLSSRLSQLEMNFRRLLSSSATKLDDADRAPAGPGVWVLTDSDLTTYYYVESCKTLRVAIPNLVRGGSVRRNEPSIKPQLAEHLGIPEARVSKYLSDHCVVRWLQMDEGASHFAHFLVAVLHPALNE
jgi:hypothetical protein